MSLLGTVGLGFGPISSGPADYPAVTDVRLGTSYNFGGSVGTLALPQTTRVRAGTSYGAGGVEFTGLDFRPAASDVRSGVGYGANNTEFIGRLVAASGVRPIGDGVTFTNQGVLVSDLLTYFERLVGMTLDFTPDANNNYRDVVLWEHPGRVSDGGRQMMVWYKVIVDELDHAKGPNRHGNLSKLKFQVNLVTRRMTDGTQRDRRKYDYHLIYRERLKDSLKGRHLFSDYFPQPVSPTVWTPPQPASGPPLTVEPMDIEPVPGTTKTQVEEGTLETAFTVVLPYVLPLTLNPPTD